MQRLNRIYDLSLFFLGGIIGLLIAPYLEGFAAGIQIYQDRRREKIGK